jgi:hypothetical protein
MLQLPKIQKKMTDEAKKKIQNKTTPTKSAFTQKELL